MNRDSKAVEAYGPKCGCCATGHLVIRFRKETFEHKADHGPVTVEADRVPVSVCDNCSSVFVTAETSRVRHEYVCRTLGLIAPAEITEIRDRHGLTKAEFARITEFGESSISRWERGRLLPNPSSSRYLKLLQHNPSMVNWLMNSDARLTQETVVDAEPTSPRPRFRSLPPELIPSLAAKANRFALVPSY
jgi:putative zinc finger/helix-turn-helix YgiT family protein